MVGFSGFIQGWFGVYLGLVSMFIFCELVLKVYSGLVCLGLVSGFAKLVYMVYLGWLRVYLGLV